MLSIHLTSYNDSYLGGDSYPSVKMSSLIIYSSSKDYEHLYKSNKPTDFYVEFDKVIETNENSTIELLEFRCHLNDKSRKDICVICDICDNSILFGHKIQILRLITLPGLKNVSCVFNEPIKINIIDKFIKKFKIYLRDVDSTSTSLEFLDMHITLRINNVSNT